MKIPVKKVLLIAAVLLAAAAVILYCTLGGKSGASAARAWSGNDDALTELYLSGNDKTDYAAYLSKTKRPTAARALDLFENTEGSEVPENGSVTFTVNVEEDTF